MRFEAEMVSHEI